METSIDPLDPVAQRRMLAAPSALAYLPWALLYPWRGFAWVSLALLAVGMWLMSVSAGAVIYTLGCLGLTLQYLFTVLGRTIDGRADPPPIAHVLSADAAAARFQTLCALALTLGAALATLSSSAAAAWTVVCVAALPACAVLLALDADLVAALDPRRLLAIIAATGIWYAVFVVLTSAALIAGGARLGSFHGDSLPEPGTTLRLLDAAGLAWMLSGVYLTTVAMHLLGVVVHRAHEDLDLRPSQRAPTAAEADRARLVHAVERLMPEVWARWDAGDHAAAERVLATTPLLRGLEHPHLEHLLTATLSRRSQVRLPVAVGRRLIAELLRQRTGRRALEVAGICLARAPGFTAGNLEQHLQLLEVAWRTGQTDLAATLQRNAEAERPEAAARIAALARTLDVGASRVVR